MANLKIFVSSTCYDLNIVRGQLRTFINNFGYEPIMSDYNDILYDPREHTHESCIKEVQNADMVILIIGSRFGGKAVPKAIEHLDFEKLKLASKSDSILKSESISITQIEILKAIELEIPIFTFIDNKVSLNHLFYEKNKMKENFIENVDFPSIEKTETAIFIFEFINFIRHRSKNNSVVEFTKFDEIQNFLKKQWSALFQRLLFEQKTRKEEIRRFDYLNTQLSDIKTTLLTTITNSDLKETARGAIKFRRLIDFVDGISINNNVIELLIKSDSFNSILEKCQISDIIQSDGVKDPSRVMYFVREDRTFIKSRFPNRISDLKIQFETFKSLSENSKKAIISAIKENETIQKYIHINETIEDYLNEDDNNENLYTIIEE